LSLATAAADYARRGWPIFPLVPRDKTPLIRGGRGCLDATTDAPRISAWWGEAPDAGIGLHCGPAAGCWVLDVDAGKPGEALIRALAERYGWPETLQAATGGGGAHYFWRYPDGRAIKNRVGIRQNGARVEGIDVRSAGGYVVLAPSGHPSGGWYQWANNAAIQEAPEWLLDLVAPPTIPTPTRTYVPPPPTERDRERRYCEAALGRACERIAGLREGRREALRNESYTAGGWVGAGLLDRGRAERDLLDAAAACGATERHDCPRVVAYGLDTGAARPRRPELRADDDWRPTAPTPRGPDLSAPPPWLDDGPEEDGPEEPGEAEPDRPTHCTDTGNARRLGRRHGADLRYCTARSADGWLVWSGSAWRPDETRQVRRWAVEVAEEVATLAAELEAAAPAADDPKTAAAIARGVAKWAAQSENDRGIRGTLACAADLPGIVLQGGELDADPWLLGVPNGTIDLRTGRLREARREDLITLQAGAPFDPSAKAPAWERFLGEVFGGDQDVIAYVRRVAGYSLVGLTSEQILLILHGNGQNGKSTFVNALRAAFGQYAGTMAPESLLSKPEGTINEGIASLASARFVAVSEIPEGRKLDEALIKEITGSEPIRVRFLNRNSFEFEPKFTIWWSLNHRPEVRGTDLGIWRRLQLVPFERTFTEAEKDPHLKAKLAAEAPGILAWAVWGCLEWQAGGLNPPERVRIAGEEYRQDSDRLTVFLADRCRAGPGEMAGNTDIYLSYKEWAEEAGEYAWSQRKLTQELKARGFVQDSRRDTGRCWRGLSLTVRARVKSDRWSDR
jgi:putative DNA primase/helicase